MIDFFSKQFLFSEFTRKRKRFIHLSLYLFYMIIVIYILYKNFALNYLFSIFKQYFFEIIIILSFKRIVIT